MKSTEKLTDKVIDIMRTAIEDAEGQEVLFCGHLDEEGKVASVEVGARGDDMSVPALFPHMSRGDVVIHNHPSGVLKPSGADLNIASMIGNEGIGFYIVDNRVKKVYAVAEPVEGYKISPISPESLCEVLMPGGALSLINENYEYRPSQGELLKNIVDSFNHNRVLAAEAGTGVGKSFAYLIPALKWAHENEERVVVSTGTINLQQQLMEKDIPFAQKILNTDLKCVLVKGRNNYLCIRRMRTALDEDSLFRDKDDQMNLIKEWAGITKTGSISDLNFMPRREVWAAVCSEAETCTGIRCSSFHNCFAMKARKEASTAGVIVVNHHLLFADLAMRLENNSFDGSAILPAFQRIIFDEAHNIEASATSFFSEGYNKFTLYKTLNRLLGKKMGKKYGLLMKLARLIGAESSMDLMTPAVDTVREKAEVLDELCLDFTGTDYSCRIEGPLTDNVSYGVMEPARILQGVILDLTELLAEEIQLLDDDMKEHDVVLEVKQVKSRLESMAAFFEKFRSYEDYSELVFWIEKNRLPEGEYYVKYVITPLDISSMMNKAVFEPYSSVVCTSATLTVNNRFDFWKNRVGLNYLDRARLTERIFDSPFNYRERVLLGVPSDLPLPDEEGYLKYTTEYIKKVLEISGGKGLILFTSYSMLKEVYEQVKPHMNAMGVTVYRQGDDERNRLLNNFKENITSVLFATESFWEGVDSPGETLKVVVICRLPFRVPTEPVLRARMDAVKERGGNPFMELSLPDAVTRLKQGFGRLMRQQSDHGVVLIMDTRVIKKRYGSIFLRSLPQCTQKIVPGRALLQDIEEFLFRGRQNE